MVIIDEFIALQNQAPNDPHQIPTRTSLSNHLMPSKSSFHLGPHLDIPNPPFTDGDPTYGGQDHTRPEICRSTHQFRRKNEICDALDGVIGLMGDDTHDTDLLTIF